MTTTTKSPGVVYLVGGAVRDGLLGLPVSDQDFVVVGSSAEAMLAEGFRQVGADFPVFLHPETQAEYALARLERKTAVGYQGFTVIATPDVTLEEDLSRRDLTINAMAQAADGTLIDPFNGQSDLKNKILRHVGPAFTEDPVRILRLARFAARYTGFTVAPETMLKMQEMVAAGEVDALVPERVWQELSRGLMERTPSRMLEVLQECGALARLLPEVAKLDGVTQPISAHPEGCVFTHVKMVLDYAASQDYSLPVRFAALLHDVGKGLTPSDQWPAHHGHEELGVPSIESVCARFKVPTTSRDLAVMVTRLHTVVHKADTLTVARVVKLLKEVDAFRRPERFEEILQACTADARGRLGLSQVAYPQVHRLRASLAAAKAVDVGALVATIKNKAHIAERVHAARVSAVKFKENRK